MILDDVIKKIDMLERDIVLLTSSLNDIKLQLHITEHDMSVFKKFIEKIEKSLEDMKTMMQTTREYQLLCEQNLVVMQCQSEKTNKTIAETSTTVNKIKGALIFISGLGALSGIVALII